MTKPPSPPYLGPAAHTSGGDNKPITRVVIHCTVSPTKEGGARDIARYFRSNNATGSAHYVVDPGEAVQVVYDGVIAWHAPPNPHSLGVELCDPMTGPGARWDTAPHREMVTIAAKLTAQLCLAYDVPIRRLTAADLKAGKHGICGHVDVSKAFKQSTHWDPGDDFPWKRFISQVQAFAATLSPTVVKPMPNPGKVKPPTLWMLGPKKPKWTRELQTLLNRHGASVKVDGVFGKTTRAAVRAFRRKAKIRPYSLGVAGPAVWRALKK